MTYDTAAAHYEGDPSYEQAAAEECEYRQQLLGYGYEPDLIEAIIHGQTIDGHGRVVTPMPVPPPPAVDTVSESVSPDDVIASEEEREAEQWRGGGKYDGIEEVMRRDVRVKGGSHNARRVFDRSALMRPTTNQLYQRMIAQVGRPRKGREVRVVRSASVDSATPGVLAEAGIVLGDLLDLVADACNAGLRGPQIRALLRLAIEREAVKPPAKAE